MHRLFAQAYFYSEIQDIFDSFVAQPFSEYFDRFNFKVFRYSFSEAIFFNRLKSGFSLSDRCKIFTSNWLWIEICENVVLNKIDITMKTMNKKLWNW